MGKSIDLTGQKFGRLTVITKVYGSDYKYTKNSHYLCNCDCGGFKVAIAAKMKNGDCRSCGCLNIETASVVGKKYGGMLKTHGDAGTKLYRTWSGMKNRCYNTKNRKYHRYGKRGISVCERWRNSYENFKKDLGESPTKHHTIDRIDNDGNYEPSNCRWATQKEQQNNKSTNVYITYKGVTESVAYWEEKTGIKEATLRYRMCRGWSIKKTLTTKTRIIKGVNDGSIKFM